jgi:hypothetical protein
MAGHTVAEAEQRLVAVQLEEGSMELPVVAGAQPRGEIGLGVVAEPLEPDLDEITNPLPERPGYTVEKREGALSVGGGRCVSALALIKDEVATHAAL